MAGGGGRSALDLPGGEFLAFRLRCLAHLWVFLAAAAVLLLLVSLVPPARSKAAEASAPSPIRAAAYRYDAPSAVTTSAAKTRGDAGRGRASASSASRRLTSFIALRRATKGGASIVKYEADFAIGQLTSRGAKASDLTRVAESQGWRRVQNPNGPIKYADRVVRLNVEGEWLTTTQDHPFWNAADQEWQPVEQLDVSDLVGASDGWLAGVREIKLERPRRATAYNLTVEGIHTYHVGQLGLLVHNTCATKATPKFSQATASEKFVHGPLAGRTIGDVASGLRSGAIGPGDLPVEVIRRGGETLALNTRSALALRRGGVDPSDWAIRDVTGNASRERLLTRRLARNDMGGGSEVIRITGAGRNASSVR